MFYNPSSTCPGTAPVPKPPATTGPAPHPHPAPLLPPNPRPKEALPAPPVTRQGPYPNIVIVVVGFLPFPVQTELENGGDGRVAGVQHYGSLELSWERWGEEENSSFQSWLASHDHLPTGTLRPALCLILAQVFRAHSATNFYFLPRNSKAAAKGEVL